MFSQCCCHLKLYPLIWKLPIFSFGASIKKPMEKYNHHADSEKRDLHWDMLKPFGRAEMFCLEEGGVVDAFLISFGLRTWSFSALRPTPRPLLPPIYLGMLRKLLYFLSFKLVSFRDALIDRGQKVFLSFYSKERHCTSFWLFRPYDLCCNHSSWLF